MQLKPKDHKQAILSLRKFPHVLSQAVSILEATTFLLFFTKYLFCLFESFI